MIDFDDEPDRLACRDAIARALDMTSPEAAMAVLWRYGEPLREALYEWNHQASNELASENQELEDERDALIVTLDTLINRIDRAADALDDIEDNSVAKIANDISSALEEARASL